MTADAGAYERRRPGPGAVPARAAARISVSIRTRALVQAMTQHDVWLCVLDNHNGRLARGMDRSSRSLHLDIVESLENRWEELEHSGRTTHSGDGQGDAHLKQRRMELLLRYAGDAARWLARTLADHEIESLDLFAPPQLLGALRAACPKKLAKKIREHRADLGHLRPEDLERHPAVTVLFKPAARL